MKLKASLKRCFPAMSDSGDQDEKDHVRGYKCPSCGAVGGHTRTIFGPENDGRNLERHCRKCQKKFLTTRAKHVMKRDEAEGGDSSSTSAGDSTADVADRCSQSEDVGEPPTPSFQKLHFSEQKFVREEIQTCSDGGHVQQVAYSTYHDALTQVCFSCKTVRTSMSEEVL